jgi:UDP-N-acetylglucosamine--N-acetylmuramyl-(pentapeptide) pyrophosphoryl-undecaprenol N-acetylglucosamine transferase
LRVYVAPCGIGLGHITRAAPIAAELDRRGEKTVFSTYLDGLDYATSRSLPTYAAVPIDFKVTSDGSIDFKMTAARSGFSLGIRMFLRQVVREIQFMKNFKPDVVFSDSRASSLIAAWLMRIPVVLMLNQFKVEIVRRPSSRHLSIVDRLFFFIANIGWVFVRTTIGLVWGRSNVIMIPDLPAPYTICLGNLAIPKRYSDKVRLIGPIVDDNHPVQEGHDKIKNELGFSSDKPSIYAAVSGPKVERRILNRILGESLPALSKDYNIVLSRGEPEGKRTPISENGITAYDWIDNQDDVIKASDVVISRAGHGTIMKSLCFGKPMVLIPIPDHTEQYGNARRSSSLHVATMIDQSKLNSGTLKAALDQILSVQDYRSSSVQIMQITGRLHGVSMACDIIESTAGRS